MANVLHHHIEFHPRPVSHAPSPFGFGFGLVSPTTPSSPWQISHTPGHTNPAAFHQLSLMNQHASSSRPQKRRHDSEDDSDQSMDRSPSPERPKRAAPKRARMVQSPDPNVKEDGPRKETKADDDDVDVGVLLASLPPQSLLPLLNSLLKAQPSLKKTILPLIPRPTLETAIQALAQSAKKLQDAYPYSNSVSFSAPTTSFGFGRAHATPGFGQSNAASGSHSSGMRDSYILSRLRPHISDFVAACMSYLPFFTCISPSQPINQSNNLHADSGLPTRSVTTIQSLHKDKFHPSETFLFLSAVTNHIIAQPPLAQTSLCSHLLPRLLEEWNTWIDKVDDVVNRQGGMFGRDAVQSWERGLDGMAEAKIADGTTAMRDIRDKWVTKVGWLVGRTVHHPMDEI